MMASTVSPVEDVGEAEEVAPHRHRVVERERALHDGLGDDVQQHHPAHHAHVQAQLAAHGGLGQDRGRGLFRFRQRRLHAGGLAGLERL
jgi:hypothetical protein